MIAVGCCLRVFSCFVFPFDFVVLLGVCCFEPFVLLGCLVFDVSRFCGLLCLRFAVYDLLTRGALRLFVSVVARVCFVGVVLLFGVFFVLIISFGFGYSLFGVFFPGMMILLFGV